MSAAGLVRPVIITGLILTAGVSLTACDKKAASDSAGFGASGTDAPQGADQFGQGFAKAARASPNSEPANVSDSDVVPVSRTAEPVAIN